MSKDNSDYVAYYRVSTRKQGDSGLGLEAQHSYINHFYKDRKIIAEFIDIHSGKDGVVLKIRTRNLFNFASNDQTSKFQTKVHCRVQS